MYLKSRLSYSVTEILRNKDMRYERLNSDDMKSVKL